MGDDGERRMGGRAQDKRLLPQYQVFHAPGSCPEAAPLLGVVGMGWGRRKGRDENKPAGNGDIPVKQERKCCRDAHGVWEGTVTESQSKLGWEGL